MPVSRLCLQCNAPFLTYPVHIRNGGGKYCSPKCQHASLIHHILKQCLTCDVPFTVTGSKKKQQFCSKACSAVAQRTAFPATCLYCAAPFFTIPSKQQKGGGKYCSKPCSDKGHAYTFGMFLSFIARCSHEPLCPYCCWQWKGQTLGGYGKFECEGHIYRAHRHAWELHNGQPMPKEFVAAHYCHTPLCCNPTHIHRATQKENIADSVKDLRHCFGEKHGNSKLLKSDIPNIFEMYKNHMGHTQIAKVFDVSSSVIYRVLTRKTWKHVVLS